MGRSITSYARAINKDSYASRPKDSADSAALPIKGGRESIPDGVTTIGSILHSLGVLTPDFNTAALPILEKLAMYNPEVSQAVDNITKLGDTLKTFPKIAFDDGVSAKVQKDAITRLKVKSKTWYAYSGGIASLTGDLLAQAATYGCLSTECVPENSLDGIKKVVLVNPKNIVFKYNHETDEYDPYQRVSGIVGADTEGILPLNNVTYSYIALQRLGEKPYAIPPFLSALFNVEIGADMAKDVKGIVKKLGAVGFLEVLLAKPKPTQAEINDPVLYEGRTRDILNKAIPEVEKGIGKGFVTGFKDEHEFKMQNMSSNVQGANALIATNDLKVYRGLKQDPLMFGENTSTTETLARVILAKMTSGVAKYQTMVTSFYNKLFLMDLQLAGFPIKSVETELPAPMIGDTLKEAQARKAELDNLILLYNQGIIDQNQVAIESGYEKPAEEEPRSVSQPATNPDGAPIDENGTDPSGGDNKADTKDTESNKKTIKKLYRGLSVVDFIDSKGNLVDNVVLIEGVSLNKLDLGRMKTHSLSPLGIESLIEVERAGLRKSSLEFPYSDTCSCGLDHDSFAKQPNDDLQSFIDDYLTDTIEVYNKASNDVMRKISEALAQYKTTVTGDELVNTVLYVLYKEWGSSFTEKEKLIIARNVKSSYLFFRKDTKALAGMEKPPKGVLDLADFRAIEYYTNSDTFYLGRFITDDDLRKKLTSYIKKEFLEDRISIDLSDKELSLLSKNLGGILEGQEWKLKRIIETTLNKVRNTAAVNYMYQAEVENFEIVGVTDRLQCGYCKNMQGKTFSVSKMMDHVKSYTASDPSFVKVDSPFITAIYKNPDEMKNVTGEELQAQGIHAPPFHANCRDQAIAIID